MPPGRKRKAPAVDSNAIDAVPSTSAAAAGNSIQSGIAKKRGRPPTAPKSSQVVVPPRQSTRKNAGGRLKEFTTAASSKRRPKTVVTSSTKKKPWEESDDEKITKKPRGKRMRTRSPSPSSSDEEEEESEDEDGNESQSASGTSEEESDYEIQEEASRESLSSTSHSCHTTTPLRDEATDEGVTCPWLELDEKEIPPLELPKPSTDLLIEKEHLMGLLSIYEVLRNFYRAIQLSPFIFEDFCAALRSPTQSKLLCEIHLALIRLLIRDDEEDQTIFSMIDTSGSFNILLQLLEPMTFGEVLKQYMESDRRIVEGADEALRIVRTCNYPFVDLRSRLVVLKWLCDRFFETITFKRLMKNEGKIVYDEHCRDCGKQGDVLLCDGCEACYHQRCAGVTELPSGLWFCAVCKLHEVKGATECYSTRENQESLVMKPPIAFRLESLGYDRFGRLYWFVARRLFVQLDREGKDVVYYSTLPQLAELTAALDPVRYERRLCRQLAAQISTTIAPEMRLTVEITDTRRNQLQQKVQKEPAKPYLHVDNAHRMAKFLASRKPQKKGRDGESRDDTELTLADEILKSLGFEGDDLVETFWAGGMTEKGLVLYNQGLEKELAKASRSRAGESLPLLEEFDLKSQRGYRLGFSGIEYREYVNQYTANDFAKSPYIRAKERDKKKYMCSRFSLLDEGEFNWTYSSGCFAGMAEVAKCIQASIGQLVEKIPEELMHRSWRSGEKAKYLEAVGRATTVDDLKFLLLQFEQAVRKPIFINAWWNSLGHITLVRITAEDREDKQKADQARKKEEKSLAATDLDDGNTVWVNIHEDPSRQPPKHGLGRLKDEQYRISGRGALGGWVWFSRTANRRYVSELPKPPIQQITAKTPLNELTTPEAQKMYRVERLARRLISWRLLEEVTTLCQQQSTETRCYSPTCRLIGTGRQTAVKVIPFSGASGELQFSCYSPSCLRFKSQYANPTTFAIKAFNPYVGHNPYYPALAAPLRPFRDVMGLGKPFPYPKPFDYKSRPSGPSNLLTLPKWAVRQLARQGGVQATNVRGFHRSAKSNPQLWPYPCARPLFDSCWQYSTLTSHSLHAVALRLRTLYACIRWADMYPDPDEPDTRVWVHKPDCDEVRWVIGHRENPPDGYYEQYKVKVQRFSLDDHDGDSMDEDYYDRDNDPDEYGGGWAGGGGGRSATRGVKHKKKSSSAATNSVFSAKKALSRRKAGPPHEVWMDGVDLKLWEIRDYWHRYFNRPPTTGVILHPTQRRPMQCSGYPHSGIPTSQNGTSSGRSSAFGSGSSVRIVLPASGNQVQSSFPTSNHDASPFGYRLHSSVRTNSIVPQLSAVGSVAGNQTYKVICVVPPTKRDGD